MLPNTHPLVIQQGATFKFWFALRLPDGSVANPTTSGYTIARLQVRDKAASDGGTVLLSLTTDNGGIALGALTDAEGRTWSGYLYASAAATAALVPWGDGVYDLELSDGSDVIRLMEGVAILSPEVSI